MTPAALIFDFDGVLVETEWVGNVQLAATLSAIGHPTTTQQALERFAGIGGPAFTRAIEAYLGGPIPPAFHAARAAEDARVMAEGVDAVAGAVAFVRALPDALPRAIASSSTTAWIRAHLDHAGLRATFEPHVYSGREHVARGKPAPDIYLYAAGRLGVPIVDCVVIEDSVTGATGAVASGARVIGLTAASHCDAAHAERLRAAGVHQIADSFEAAARALGLPSV